MIKEARLFTKYEFQVKFNTEPCEAQHFNFVSSFKALKMNKTEKNEGVSNTPCVHYCCRKGYEHWSCLPFLARAVSAATTF